MHRHNSRILREENFSWKFLRFERVRLKIEVIDNQLVRLETTKKPPKCIPLKCNGGCFLLQRMLFLILTEPVSHSYGWHLTQQFMLFYIVK